jgi:hypothetical protein
MGRNGEKKCPPWPQKFTPLFQTSQVFFIMLKNFEGNQEIEPLRQGKEILDLKLYLSLSQIHMLLMLQDQFGVKVHAKTGKPAAGKVLIEAPTAHSNFQESPGSDTFEQAIS